jgi:type IV fimbrial biogenesis protein FimT
MIMKRSIRNNHGFTMLEVITVVIVIGILAALAVPTFDEAIKKIKFKAASNTIMADLRMARSNAITKKIQHVVDFDASSNVISVFSDINDPSGFVFEESDSILFQDTLASGFQQLTTTFSDDVVFFFPDGRASTSGNITGNAEWGEASASVQISILAATGRVKMDSLSY